LYGYADGDPVSLSDPFGLGAKCGDIPRRESFGSYLAWANAAKEYQLCH